MTISSMLETTVGEVMSKGLQWVSESTSIDELTTLLVERGVSAVPVLDERRRPVGIITKTDLVKLRRGDEVTVADLMTSTTYSLQESTSIADAIATMGFEGIHHAPVVDASGAVTGMLTSIDLLRWLAEDQGYKPAIHGSQRAFDRR